MYRLALLLSFGLLQSAFAQTPIEWTQLETGLNYASVLSPVKSSIGDSKINILKIDPKYFSFDLICAGQKKSEKKTADKWAKENNLIACVNSSMFKLEGDFMTSTGYMKNGKYINNPTLNPAYKSVFAFNPKDSSLPKAHIIDLSCEPWPTKKDQYGSFSQSLRMIDCNGKNTWQPQQKKWSMVLLGEDKEGNILFIFVRSPYKVFDYINILQGLPISLTRLMYLEGGPEASMYVNHPKLKLEKCGSYETGFVENDSNDHFWDVPNVIGIRRR
jgi:hypothetical protein